MWKCKYCNNEYEFLSTTQKANHSRWCKSNPKYIDILKNKKIKIQKYPNGRTGIKLTEEHKKSVSNGMKMAHAEGRHPGFSFINKDKNRRSYPEKYFLECIGKYDFFKKFHIEEKYSFGKYFLDFAVIELMLDIEIDGSQHWRTDDAIKHDKTRDAFLNYNGWKTYRISWIELKNNAKKEIDLLVEYIENLNNTSNRYYNLEEIEQLKKKNKKKKKYIPRPKKPKQLKFKCTKIDLEHLIKKKSFSEIGRMFGVSDNTVRNMCKKYGIDIPKNMRGYWAKIYNNKNIKFEITKENLLKLLNTYSKKYICKKYNIGITTLNNKIKEHDIQIENKIKEITEQDILKIKEYKIKELSNRKIAKILRVSRRRVDKIIKKL